MSFSSPRSKSITSRFSTPASVPGSASGIDRASSGSIVAALEFRRRRHRVGKLVSWETSHSYPDDSAYLRRRSGWSSSCSSSSDGMESQVQYFRGRIRLQFAQRHLVRHLSPVLCSVCLRDSAWHCRLSPGVGAWVPGPPGCSRWSILPSMLLEQPGEVHECCRSLPQTGTRDLVLVAEL